MIANPANTLTPRQVEYLALYASGNDLRRIASIKFVSYQLVQRTLSEARDRVGARSLAHLATLALETGVIVRNGIGFKPVVDERVIAE